MTTRATQRTTIAHAPTYTHITRAHKIRNATTRATQRGTGQRMRAHPLTHTHHTHTHTHTHATHTTRRRTTADKNTHTRTTPTHNNKDKNQQQHTTKKHPHRYAGVKHRVKPSRVKTDGQSLESIEREREREGGRDRHRHKRRLHRSDCQLVCESI